MPRVQFQYEGQTKTFTFGPEATTKDHISNEMKRLWGLDFNEICLTYADADGDQISVDIQDDFDLARDTMTGEQDLLVFKVKLNEGVAPRFLEEKVEEKVEVNVQEVKVEAQLEERKEEKTTEPEIGDAKLEEQKTKAKAEMQAEKLRLKAQLQERKKLEALAIHQAKMKLKAEEAERKRLAQIAKKEALKEAERIKKQEAKQKKEAQKKEALEKKQQKLKQAAEKKEKAPKCPSSEEEPVTTTLTEQRAKALVREEVLKMIPELKKLILQNEPPKVKASKAQKQEEGSCETCQHRLQVPFYFNPSTKGYLCEACEKLDVDKTPLLKIRDPQHFANTFYTYGGVLSHAEINQSYKQEPENLIEAARIALMSKVKLDFKMKMNERKKKVPQKKNDSN